MVSAIIQNNGLERGHYAEPYAGGCGLALSLLLEGYMHELHLNDIDRSIYAFWHSVLNSSDDLIEMIYSTDITMNEWSRQREVQSSCRHH
jgi:DNA adenine methylase